MSSVKRFPVLIFFSLMILMLTASVASAEIVRVDAVLAGTESIPAGNPAPSSGFGFPGGGLVFDFPFARFVEFEVSGLYLSTQYSARGANYTVTKGDVTGGLRFDVSRVISVNGGVFYDLLFSNPQSLSGVVLGAVGGLSFNFPLRKGLDFFVSAQYHYEANTLSYAGGTLQPTEIIALVGFRFAKMSGN